MEIPGVSGSLLEMPMDPVKTTPDEGEKVTVKGCDAPAGMLKKVGEIPKVLEAEREPDKVVFPVLLIAKVRLPVPPTVTVPKSRLSTPS